jgi:hypothetical protein
MELSEHLLLVRVDPSCSSRIGVGDGMCDPQIDPRRVDPTVARDVRMFAASTSKDSSGEPTRCKVDLCVVYPRNMLGLDVEIPLEAIGPYG